MIVLKAPQEKVLSALQSVSGIVERRHTLPVLANVLIRKTGSSLQLTTSDLEIQIRTTVELDGDVEGCEVDLQAGWCVQDRLRSCEIDGSDAVVVDEERQAVGGGPDVAAGPDCRER